MAASRFVLGLLFLAAMSVRAQEQNRLLQQGDEMFFQKQTDIALPLYEEAYKLDPRDNGALIRLIRACSDLGWLRLHKDSSAEHYYRRAAVYADTLLAVSPDLPSAHFWKAMTSGSLIPFGGVSEKLKLGKEVRLEAEKTIELDSTFALAYIILAIFERESAQLSWLERTIARVIFGEELHGSFQASEEFLAQAVKYEPANSYAYYERYWTYLAEGRKDAAAESLKRVLAIPARSQREEQQRQLAQEYLENLQKSSE